MMMMIKCSGKIGGRPKTKGNLKRVRDSKMATVRSTYANINNGRWELYICIFIGEKKEKKNVRVTDKQTQ